MSISNYLQYLLEHPARQWPLGSNFPLGQIRHGRPRTRLWILSYVYDAGRDQSDVVILDARDFGGDPVATIRLPVRVPYGFHGGWVPDGSPILPVA
jgi:hypothetical protein